MNDIAYVGYEGETDSIFITIDGNVYQFPFTTLLEIKAYAQKEHDSYKVRHW